MFSLFSLISLLLISIKCEEDLQNITTNSTQNSKNNSNDSSFEDIGDQNKVIFNLNKNCSTHEDCDTKHSICDQTYNSCECDLTSMQIQMKCQTVFCHSSEECRNRFPESLCTLGRCQCMSGRKLNGRCIRGMGMGMMSSNALPDWAIISIAVTLAMSVLAGGSLKKREVRQQLMKIIRFFLMRDENDKNSNSSNDNQMNKTNEKEIEI